MESNEDMNTSLPFIQSTNVAFDLGLSLSQMSDLASFELDLAYSIVTALCSDQLTPSKNNISKSAPLLVDRYRPFSLINLNKLRLHHLQQ
ncbi:hypothetical protein MJO28_009159 [Puccinia striiformis f. sp. tritici]|uniref:Uncharacterized protein n=1 Tax=Puccinia striiformis f. sp. tritici TaxID=168172 RepID=A0ACC0E6B9_9BASI|nr:hypothetical protein MJO28_009159 [Puccinia striiformis f. sp. tritici]